MKSLRYTLMLSACKQITKVTVTVRHTVLEMRQFLAFCLVKPCRSRGPSSQHPNSSLHPMWASRCFCTSRWCPEMRRAVLQGRRPCWPSSLLGRGIYSSASFDWTWRLVGSRDEGSGWWTKWGSETRSLGLSHFWKFGGRDDVV